MIKAIFCLHKSTPFDKLPNGVFCRILSAAGRPQSGEKQKSAPRVVSNKTVWEHYWHRVAAVQECDKKNWRYLVFTTRYRLFLSLTECLNLIGGTFSCLSPHFAKNQPIGKDKRELFRIDGNLFYHALKYGRFKLQHGLGIIKKIQQKFVWSIVSLTRSGSWSWRNSNRSSSISLLLRLLRSIKMAESMHPLACNLESEWFCLAKSEIFWFKSTISGLANVVLLWSSISCASITLRMRFLLSSSLLYIRHKQ